MALDNIPTIGPGGLNANLDKVLVYKNGGSEVASSISTLVSYAARPSGVAGSIQFSDGSALASSSNLFWDNTNSRLGIGTNAPIYTADIAGNLRVTDGSFSLNYTGNSSNGSLINAGTYPSFKVTNAAGVIRAILGSDGPNGYLTLQENGTTYTYLTGTATGNAGYSYFLSQLGVGSATSLGAKFGVKGSGSTSATTSLLVQNSGGNTSLEILDDRKSTFRGVVNVTPPTITGGSEFFRVQSGNGYSALITGFENGTLGLGASGGLIGYGNSLFSYVVGSNFILNYVPTNNTNTYAISISTGFTNNGAGGTSEGAMLRLLGSTATAVGNVTLNQIEVKNTINNTGGTTINRGFYYAPTVTSVVNTQNIAFQSTSGSVNINTATIQASAILQADSTTQGFLPPRMTTLQKNAIATPAAGLMVYDTDLARPCFHNGTSWITL